jgi:NADP-dependent 3-hydroxy acid dehydrogenase YdfG
MPLSIDFSGKLVLITGGGRGIGLAITEALAVGKYMSPLSRTPTTVHWVLICF